MDLDRMLEKCRRDQWSPKDLDWTRTPRALSRDDEIAIVQYFTDMAGIERLAGALFREQAERTDDPTLRSIFRTFVVDEERHAVVAERLAKFYDVHQYRPYGMNESLTRFRPHFMDAIRYLSDDVANAYVTTGELILDVALLRSIDDFVKDEMSAQAMHLINRDESRHIAVDFHMVEYYSSPAYAAKLRTQTRPRLADRLRAWWSFGNVLYHAAPFLRAVFFEPMDRVDPSGKRIREAFKRVQLLSQKPGVSERPFSRFMLTLQDIFNHPLAGPIVGRFVARIAGLEPRFMQRLYTDDDARRVQGMSFDALADEALSLKYAG